MKDKVSIIISNHNYGRYLAECINSVLNQDYPNIEIILVDDGSTDDSLEVIKEFQNKITVIKQENSGVVIARNNGFNSSSGDFVCFLDADDMLAPNYVSCLLAVLKDSADASFAYGRARMFGEVEGYAKCYEWNSYKLYYKNIVSGVNALIRSSAFKHAGCFSEYMGGKYGYEDWDLWIKMAKKGMRGVHTHGTHFLYRIHGHGRDIEGQKNHRMLFRQIQTEHKELYSKVDVRIAVLVQKIFWRAVFEFRKLFGKSNTILIDA